MFFFFSIGETFFLSRKAETCRSGKGHKKKKKNELFRSCQLHAACSLPTAKAAAEQLNQRRKKNLHKHRDLVDGQEENLHSFSRGFAGTDPLTASAPPPRLEW